MKQQLSNLGITEDAFILNLAKDGQIDDEVSSIFVDCEMRLTEESKFSPDAESRLSKL